MNTLQSTAIELNQVDQDKLNEFLQRFIQDFGAMVSGVMTAIGYRLGLYEAMHGAGPLTSIQLADKTDTAERYVREWLNNQAAGGYVMYDPVNETYTLPAEQAMVLAEQKSPFYLVPGMVYGIPSMWADEEKVIRAFRTGEGIPWHDHDQRLFLGNEYTFKPGYEAYLVGEWLPALTGVEAKLKAGAKVADIGCGHGASTIIMARAYPNSRFWGFDYHHASIETAKMRAREAGVEDRITFEVASAKNYPENDYDMICFMDCFHDLGDPLGAASKALAALKSDGTLMLVEPSAGDDTQQNLNPIGRIYYAFSSTACCPNSISQEVGTALGAQAGQKKLSAILEKAGFTHIRRAADNPFNMVLEAKR